MAETNKLTVDISTRAAERSDVAIQFHNAMQSAYASSMLIAMAQHHEVLAETFREQASSAIDRAHSESGGSPSSFNVKGAQAALNQCLAELDKANRLRTLARRIDSVFPENKSQSPTTIGDLFNIARAEAE